MVVEYPGSPHDRCIRNQRRGEPKRDARVNRRADAGAKARPDRRIQPHSQQAQCESGRSFASGRWTAARSKRSSSTLVTNSPTATACPPSVNNALYMDRYPLVSAISRPLIVKHLVAAAREHGGGIVAHGCTGKGNDQVRFEVGFASLAPDLEVLAPVRDYAWTREKAIAFAEENAIPINVTKRSPFSIDQNVWGRAVETGFLEHLWNAPTKDVYDYTEDPTVNWNTPDEVIVGFERGVPVTIDGNSVSVLQAIEELNRRAGAQGVGRLDVVEDRLVGIKSREIYEAPGAMVLITAHTELEHVTLERELGRFKRHTDQRWAELVYDGLWYSPLKTALGELRRQDPGARHPARSEWCCTAGTLPSTAGAAPSRSTTSTWPPTTRATPSTSRWREASSTCTGCRPSWPLAGTWPPTKREHQRGIAVGRAVRRRPVRCAGRAEQVHPLRLGAGALRRHRVQGPRSGAFQRRTAHRRSARRTCWPVWTAWPRVSPTGVSGR